MRIALLAFGIGAACLLAAWSVSNRWVALPPVNLPSIDAAYAGVEPVCVDAMRQRPPDLTWAAPGRDAMLRGRTIRPTALEHLQVTGRPVRVAGVLHVEFEWATLYASRDAIWLPHGYPRKEPWVNLLSLWPEEPFWLTKAPSISDRCVTIEGTYTGGGGHMDGFNGVIDNVLRLEVWSTPHRPLPKFPVPVPTASEPATERRSVGRQGQR